MPSDFACDGWEADAHHYPGAVSDDLATEVPCDACVATTVGLGYCTDLPVKIRSEPNGGVETTVPLKEECPAICHSVGASPVLYGTGTFSVLTVA